MGYRRKEDVAKREKRTSSKGHPGAETPPQASSGWMWLTVGWREACWFVLG